MAGLGFIVSTCNFKEHKSLYILIQNALEHIYSCTVSFLHFINYNNLYILSIATTTLPAPGTNILLALLKIHQN